MTERSLQPPHLDPLPPKDEDEAYDDYRQRRLDDETARDELRAKAEEDAVQAAARFLGLRSESAISSLRVLYQLGYMDGVLNASREALL